MVPHALVTAVTLLAALAQAQPSAQPASVSAEDFAVIDAALDHKTRKAMNTSRPRGIVLMLDRTLEPCADQAPGIGCIPHDDRTVNYVQRAAPELTTARLDMLVARNAVPRVLAAAPAKDVIIFARENVIAVRKKYDANVEAVTSLPVYFDDGTALMFLEFSCGGLCGEGNFLLLKRGADGWKVTKAVLTWVS